MSDLEFLFEKQSMIGENFRDADNELFLANQVDPFNHEKIDRLAARRRRLFNALSDVNTQIYKLLQEMLHD